jgi:hypothetical protein
MGVLRALSSEVERLSDAEEVGGSSPPAPTRRNPSSDEGFDSHRSLRLHQTSILAGVVVKVRILRGDLQRGDPRRGPVPCRYCRQSGPAGVDTEAGVRSPVGRPDRLGWRPPANTQGRSGSPLASTLTSSPGCNRRPQRTSTGSWEGMPGSSQPPPGPQTSPALVELHPPAASAPSRDLPARRSPRRFWPGPTPGRRGGSRGRGALQGCRRGAIIRSSGLLASMSGPD